MPYSYIEHPADIGIHAEGSTLEEAFASGVEAMLNVMLKACG
jgi:SHS2 domain-containing protein